MCARALSLPRVFVHGEFKVQGGCHLKESILGRRNRFYACDKNATNSSIIRYTQLNKTSVFFFHFNYFPISVRLLHLKWITYEYPAKISFVLISDLILTVWHRYRISIISFIPRYLSPFIVRFQCLIGYSVTQINGIHNYYSYWLEMDNRIENGIR